ncbi:SIS domain-containing protein [Morganella psychrotolerans]|uniref:SIS domain-containing protein n=1 Tax=Morganella psychrotolerans TaxID=368603 RepID=UPI0039B0C103
MAILTKISWARSELATNQQYIADFILAQPEMTVTLSSQALAERVGVSQSAIVKFSQKMGFKGFPALKMAISEEIGRNRVLAVNQQNALHNRIETHDSLLVISQKLAQEKQNSIAETTRRLDFEQVAHIVACLDSARCIQVAGIGGSGLTAKDLAYKLQKIGLMTLAEADHHVQIAFSQTLTEKDVLVVLSFSGKRRDMLVTAATAKKQNATLIAITGNRLSPLAKMADYVLETVAEENEWRSSSISSRTAQNTVTDLLFMALLQRREEQARQLVNNARTMINSLDG